MFGYIIADKQQMSDDDQIRYKGYYCGLCRELRNEAGVRGSVILSYDVTFLYILLSGLYEPKTNVTVEHCKVHPMKKQMVFTNEYVRYAAAVNILLGYYNLLDDYHDDHNIRKRQLAGYLKRFVDQIAEQYPRQAETCAQMIEEITNAEKRREENIDIPAGQTGQMLGELFVMNDDMWADDLRNMGFYIGKFVYVLDAYLDIDKDRKSGSYNPLIAKKDKDPKGFEDYIEMSLTSFISEAARTFERLPIIEDASIIRNVLYSGAWGAFRNYRARQNNHGEDAEEDRIGSLQGTRRIV